MQLHPYLTFPGTCAEAFSFYEEVFGGEVEHMAYFRDGKALDDTPPEMLDKVMHARLRIGERHLMGSDAMDEHYEQPRGIYVQMSISDIDRARRIFQRLAKNGTVKVPFEPTFWAAGFGICRDRYGTPWMINCDADSLGA